ncbi:hypothetical protein [Ruegeria arenilitoris]|uniref:hypothetical protein n=1 Tax=Ruegeria arenilitoris TaxID=1173585 RepID=UPI00147E028E|nr:hypothetical protein [Ruegeria arenilitoris]
MVSYREKYGVCPEYTRKHIERSAAYHKANPEWAAERQQAYRKRHPDRIAARAERDREKNNARMRAYKKANPEIRAAENAVRRAAKMDRTPNWLTKEQRAEMRLAYAMRTNLEYETGEQHHVDHIVPLQGENISGLHVPWNLRVISAFENVSKGNKFETEWDDQD